MRFGGEWRGRPGEDGDEGQGIKAAADKRDDHVDAHHDDWTAQKEKLKETDRPEIGRGLLCYTHLPSPVSESQRAPLGIECPPTSSTTANDTRCPLPPQQNKHVNVGQGGRRTESSNALLLFLKVLRKGILLSIFNLHFIVFNIKKPYVTLYIY